MSRVNLEAIIATPVMDEAKWHVGRRKPAMTAAGLLAILTDTTCGEACWHAREEICRCECGGKNHGCLRTAGGVRPVRSSKIAGVAYELKAVGWGYTQHTEAQKLNHWSRVGFVSLNPVTDSEGRVMFYNYHWNVTDEGAPARVRFATLDQLDRWEELQAFRDNRDKLRSEGVALLWVRRDYQELVAKAAEQHAHMCSDAYKFSTSYRALCDRLRRRDAQRNQQ